MIIYYQDKKKLFYLIPDKFPEWKYPSRYAISFKFDDFRGMKCHKWEFTVSKAPFPYNKYRFKIDREKAIKIGRENCYDFLAFPNLIPLEEFEIIKPIEK